LATKPVQATNCGTENVLY